MKEKLEHEILEFHPDMLLHVREACGLGAPGRVDEAVGLLRDWLAQQEHLLRKDFPEILLEKLIILSKGSIEKAKQRIEVISTMRTLASRFFCKCDAKYDFSKLHDMCKMVMLPKVTKDNYRMCVIKVDGPHYDGFFLDLCQQMIILYEYLGLHDYSIGYSVIIDVSKFEDMMEFVTKINLIDLRDFSLISIKGYGARLQAIHCVTNSKAVNIFVAMIKQVVSAKLVSRIHVHKNAEELHKYVPRRILPEDLGGEERPMGTLYDAWLEALSTEEHVSHMKGMQEVGTDETRRRTQRGGPMFGLPGTFRALNVD